LSSPDYKIIHFVNTQKSDVETGRSETKHGLGFRPGIPNSVGRLFNITKNNLILHHFIVANYVILRNFPQNLQIYGFHSGTVDKKK
jgi:hypothetical protein